LILEELAMSDKDQILEILLKEYDKLKSEQAQRIGFRDNLIYVTLGIFGTVVSFAVSNSANYYALLVIPWVCLILGWTYVVNDEKISALGEYIRTELAQKVEEKTRVLGLESIFRWESYRREAKGRKLRKIEQFIVNQITFVISGIVALIAFWYLVPKALGEIKILAGVEFVLLLALAWEIWNYADLSSALEKPPSATDPKK
jgi:NADH:ubiquinone oxidoreductase subunit 3 (subunit A)